MTDPWDLFTIDPADFDPRDVVDEPEPDADEQRCAECDEPCDDIVCDECVEAVMEAWSHPATRGDGKTSNESETT